MAIDIRGLTFDRPANVRANPAPELSADAEALMDALDGHSDAITQATLDGIGQRLGLNPGRLEAATLSAIWAGRLRRD